MTTGELFVLFADDEYQPDVLELSSDLLTAMVHFDEEKESFVDLRSAKLAGGYKSGPSCGQEVGSQRPRFTVPTFFPHRLRSLAGSCGFVCMARVVRRQV